ncbi:MAG TPA: cupin domain-containing protein [Methylomirabilota bacterium]|nr:cupin domain-containing protein [Methylomirabilota bacterium]
MSQTRLTIDDGVFRAHFPYRHFRIAHHLADHPLFTLDRLLRLARTQPRGTVEYYSGAAAVSQDPGSTPVTGLSLEETVRTIDRAGSWVVLKYVERDPEYRALLAECVEELRARSEAIEPGTHRLEAYIFISSPASVTPYHFDEEHNFLLQIRGSKLVHTWTLEQAGIDQLAVERIYGGGHRNQPFPDAIAALATTFRLAPGDGLHIPVHTPHWVKNGDDVSVSFSVTFRSRRIARDAAVHWLNGKLRRYGFSPRPPGASAVRDRAKYMGARLTVHGSRVLRRLGVIR